MTKFDIQYHIQQVEDDYSRIIHIYCMPAPGEHAFAQEPFARAAVSTWIAQMRDANIIHEEDAVRPRFWWDGKPDDWWFQQGNDQKFR